MRFVNKIKSIVKEPRILLDYILYVFFKPLNDSSFLKIKYRYWFGEDLNLDNPQTFNEKLNWLKLYDRNPQYTVMADKFYAKKWVADKIGDEYIVPCYGHWQRYEDIDFHKLPQVFFLKSNQDSGGGMLVDQNKGIDYKSIKKRFSSKRIAKKNWYWISREWAYKHIEPCILAEEYLDEGTGREVHDYKFWCFNGKPTYMYITNKGDVIKENFYDMDFNPVYLNHGFERTIPEYEKPESFDKMKEIASVLSSNIPFVRIDFFNINGRPYFGECTFYDWGGFKAFTDLRWDYELGQLIKLPDFGMNV